MPCDLPAALRSARWAVLLAGLIVTASAATASAATGPPLSAAAYRTHANSICVREQVASVNRLHESKSLTDYLADEIPILHTALTDLTRLDPPAALASLGRQIVTTVRAEATLFGSLAARSKAGKLTVAQWQNNEKLEQLDSRELAIWTQIGATSCANP
jgi:hypothetical protein